MRLFIVSITTILVLMACDLDKNTVAVVGNLEITKDEFKAKLAQKYGYPNSPQPITDKMKKQALDELILAKQKLNEAYTSQLDKSDEFQERYLQRKRQLLANIYYKKNVVEKFKPDSLVTDALDKMKIEINASDILLSFNEAKESVNNRTKEQAYQLAKQIVQQVKDGASIDQLALKYSDDKSKTENKGNLGYFTWGKLEDKLENTAFSLKLHEVSEPVLTVSGYHIIYIRDIRQNTNVNPQNMEREKQLVTQQIYKKVRSDAGILWKQHVLELIEKKNYVLQKDNIHDFVDKNIEYSKTDTLTPEIIKKNYPSITLVTWNNYQCSSAEFLDACLQRYNNKFSTIRLFLTNYEGCIEKIDEFASHLFIAQISEEQGFLNDADVQNLLNSYSDYALIALVEKKSVDEQITLSDEDLKNYYNAHLPEFTEPERMELWEIYVSDEKQAKQVYALVSGGKDFEQLASKYCELENLKKIKGKLGFLTRDVLGAITEKAFTAGPNKLLVPFKYKKGWVVIKTGNKNEKIIHSFDRSLMQITNKLRMARVNKKRNEWENYLKKEYPADINEDLLAKI